MNITIIGGGNMGCVLAAKFSSKANVTLYLNSHKSEYYTKNMQSLNEDSGIYTMADIRLITEDLSEAVNNAEYIFITFPSFMFDKFAKDLIPLLKKGQHLVFVPGSGGAEIVFKDALSKGCTITGLQRVHSVARIIEQGKEVRESGIRKSIHVASIPGSFNEEACKTLGELYSLPVDALDNYLNITLINSNPILHTSRLYTIFKDYLTEKEYAKLPLFYEEWDIESSMLLIQMDKELFRIIAALEKIGIKVKEITSLLKHYESTDAEGMTKKLNSINSLKGLTTPHIVNENGKLEPDLKSRYFTADFPYGLDILLSFSRVLKTECPHMAAVSKWYHKIMNSDKHFLMSDYGIHGIEDLLKLYLI